MKSSHAHHHDEESELVLDADSGEEVVLEDAEVSLSALKDKLKQVRADLVQSRKERDEYLAGWQRAKADLVNYRRVADEDRIRDGARARGKVVEALVPTLDAFASAMAEKRWLDVDVVWREGVERTVAQMRKALEAEGLAMFGSVGEVFDPSRHECMSVLATEDETVDNTIAQVLQSGYMVGTEVVRPAKVSVFQIAE